MNLRISRFLLWMRGVKAAFQTSPPKHTSVGTEASRKHISIDAEVQIMEGVSTGRQTQLRWERGHNTKNLARLYLWIESMTDFSQTRSQIWCRKELLFSVQEFIICILYYSRSECVCTHTHHTHTHHTQAHICT